MQQNLPECNSLEIDLDSTQRLWVTVLDLLLFSPRIKMGGTSTVCECSTGKQTQNHKIRQKVKQAGQTGTNRNSSTGFQKTGTGTKDKNQMET